MAAISDLFSDVNDVPTSPLSKGSAVDQLRAINWNFLDRVQHSKLEALHPYPAKFIAEIPRAILRCLPLPKGTAVLDPFCGSGTTLAECQLIKAPSVGVDLNPIACLISRVRTSPVPEDIDRLAIDVLRRANDSREVTIPDIPNLDHWFKQDVQLALAKITVAIDEVENQHGKDILKLALSSIVVRVSNQDSDTRYAAVAKPVAYPDVFEAFKRAAAKILSALRSRSYPLTPARVIEADTLSISAKDIGMPIGLVITSPPYPNAYEYWLYHKYRMWWLGADPIAVKEKEIGARAHFFKRNHHTADDFVRQMDGTFSLLSQVVVKNGYACFIVGRSKIHGAIIDNAKIIETAAQSRGFEIVFRVERDISRHKKSFNLSHANIKTESVLIFKRCEA